jgi:hypothetical protein
MHKENTSLLSRIQVVCILVAIMCLGIVTAKGQTKAAWQAGTLIQVKAQDNTSSGNDAAKEYNVTIQVGSKLYVASLALKNGEPDLEYYVGMARMVLIDGDVLTFNDLLGHSHSMRILSSKDTAEAEEK